MNDKSKAIHERIKYLREEILNIKQNDMSCKINLQSGSLSDIERKKTKTVTDRVINDICREFNVNENWLRYGKGEVFIENDSTILSSLIYEYKLDSIDKKIVEGYITLTSDQRDVIKTYVNSLVNDINDENAASKDEEDEIKEELESYRLELEAEKKGTKSSVLENGENIG